MEASFTNKIQEMEERISGIEEVIEKIDKLVKENVKFETFLAHLVNYEKTKPNNNRGRRRNPDQRLRKMFSTKS